jgi:hypothetical protein
LGSGFDLKGTVVGFSEEPAIWPMFSVCFPGPWFCEGLDWVFRCGVFSSAFLAAVPA